MIEEQKETVKPKKKFKGSIFDVLYSEEYSKKARKRLRKIIRLLNIKKRKKDFKYGV